MQEEYEERKIRILKATGQNTKATIYKIYYKIRRKKYDRILSRNNSRGNNGSIYHRIINSIKRGLKSFKEKRKK